MLWIQRRTIAASFPDSIFGAFKIKQVQRRDFATRLFCRIFRSFKTGAARIQRRGPAVCRANCGEPAAPQKRAAKPERGQTSRTGERKRARKQETGRKTAPRRLFVWLPPRQSATDRKPALKSAGRRLCQNFRTEGSFFAKGWSETQTFGGGGGIFYGKIRPNRLFDWPKGQLA